MTLPPKFYHKKMRLQSASLEEAGGIRLLHAREVGEHLHEVASIASTQNLVAHILVKQVPVPSMLQTK